MTTPIQDLSLILSREELRYLLFLLQSGPIVGMDLGLGEQKSDEKETLALSLAHAEHSLRARDWVNINDDGKVVVRDNILLMVGTCAYPEFLLSVHSFPVTGLAYRVYWNGRNGAIVAHERPESPLHRLSFVNGRDELFQQFLTASHIQVFEKFEGENFTTTNPLLKEVREALKSSQLDAMKMLQDEGATENVAQELAKILAEEHVVTAVHSLVAQENGETVKSAVTILAGATSTWLSVTNEDDTVDMKPTGKDEIQELFASWTAPADDWIQLPQA